jgi:hypothetical protein
VFSFGDLASRSMQGLRWRRVAVLSGGVAMAVDGTTFADLMADAQHVMTALDGVMSSDSAKATAAAVSDGMRLYSLFLDFRGSVRMSQEENWLLQGKLDMLRARLRFFGEPV